MGEDGPELMTVAEVAQALRVDRSTLWRWGRAGHGPTPVYLAPRVPRYRRVEVVAFVEQLGGAGSPEPGPGEAGADS